MRLLSKTSLQSFGVNVTPGYARKHTLIACFVHLYRAKNDVKPTILSDK
jgi:hypothetical protein